jgi:hypothetical protein
MKIGGFQYVAGLMTSISFYPIDAPLKIKEYTVIDILFFCCTSTSRD